MTRRAPASLLALSILSSGCSELEPFLPKVSFDRLDVNEIDFTHIDSDFVFRIDNPNPIEVGLTSITYSLDLEGQHLLDGDLPEGIQLESEGSSDMPIRVDLGFNDIYQTVDATTGEDHVGFRLKGDFSFDTPAGEVTLPYDEDGDFPALRTPRFDFDALRIARIGLWGADLELDLGVTNEHGSTLFFDAFDYAVTLNEEAVASGLVQTFEVAGAEEGTLTLPVAVDFLTAGAAVVDAIVLGEAMDVGLSAGMDVDTPFGVIPLSIDETGNLTVTD